MTACLCNTSIFHNNDLVKIEMRKYSMRNYNRCFIVQVFIKTANNFFFSSCIYCTQAIIEDHNLRFFKQCTCNRYPLLLSPAQRNSPLPYHCFKFLIETVYFIVNACLFCCINYFFFISTFSAETDIIFDGITEKKNILRNITDL